MSYRRFAVFFLLLCSLLIGCKSYFVQVIIHNFADIDDYKIFENRTIQKGTPLPWPESPDKNKSSLSAEHLKYMESMKSIAFLVIQNGEILHEQYWQGFGSSSYSGSFSMAKSYISALIGIALDEKKIASLDQTLGELIPEYAHEGRADISIRHLLTMSSGLDYSEKYFTPFSQVAKSYYTNDLRGHARSIKKIYPAGNSFEYQSINQIFLALVLEKVTGKSVSEYLSEKLWQPLGSENDATWSLDDVNGLEKTYCCLNSNARDFARLGQLYLNHGRWNGKQLISEKYIRESVKPSRLNHMTNPIYGYSWWLMEHKGLFVHHAWGFMGQHIMVVPNKQMVIVHLGKYEYPEDDPLYGKDIESYLDAGLSVAH